MASMYKMWRFCSLFFILSFASAKPKSNLQVLNEDSWTDLLEGEWLVKFYAPWCPACKALSPVWEDVAGWSDDLNIKVAKIDVTENPGLSGRFLVTSLPTLYHVKEGRFRQYRGPRQENDIISFVDDKKWEDVPVVPWYTSPTSYHMAALGMFFKVSMAIRDMHDKMTTDYGIPVWGSYTIFAVATIILGLLLGLLIVFLCDVLLPSSPSHHTFPPRPPSGELPPGFRRRPYDDDKESDIVDDLPPREAQSPVSEDGPREDEGTSGEADAAAATASVSQEEAANRSQDEASEDSAEGEADKSQESQEEGATGGDVQRRERPKTARRRAPRADPQ